MLIFKNRLFLASKCNKKVKHLRMQHVIFKFKKLIKILGKIIWKILYNGLILGGIDDSTVVTLCLNSKKIPEITRFLPAGNYIVK